MANLAELKKQKTDIALEIKKLEETPKAKMKSIWMTLIYIIAIASVAVILAKPKIFYIPLALFVIVLALGIGNRIIVAKKNASIDSKLLKLKTEEKRLTALITEERRNTPAQAAEQSE